MTLSVRNNFFKGGIALASLFLGLVLVAGYFAYPAFPEAASSSAMRSQGMIQSIIAGFTFAIFLKTAAWLLSFSGHIPGTSLELGSRMVYPKA